jgi:hypothetical protein
MDYDPHADEVREALARLGYSVEPIPTTTEDSADLWVHAGDDCLIVEVKARIDDLDVVEDLARSPSTVITREGQGGRTDQLGRIVHKARNQIVASQVNLRGLGVLWFRETPALGPSHAARTMMANLLGIRVVCFHRHAEFNFADALLTGRTDFHRYPEIDAAVLEDERGFRLLINPYSPRRGLVRKTRLHCHCGRFNAVFDVEALESTDQHFVLRSDVDRADDAAVLEALAEQHAGYRFTFASTSYFKGYVRFHLPPDALEDD